MNVRPSLTALLLAGLLIGCNDNDSASSEPQQKMGYGESELYDPTSNPEGALLPEGATAVLSLEAANTPLHEGDTGGVGYDELWFEWPRPTVLGLLMEDEDLGVIARAELWDANGGLHLQVDAENRYAEVDLPAGPYGLRLYAAHDDPTPVSAFIRYELGEESANSRNVRAKSSDSLDVDMALQYGRCMWCDLRGANLSGADFSVGNLYRANLAGANLAGANLARAILEKANLDGANLIRANLQETKLYWAKLNGANLQEANLDGALLFEAWLVEASLRRAKLYGAELSGAKLQGADLTWAYLMWAELPQADLRQADLRRAELGSANLAGADLTDADLRDVDLAGADLHDADLTGANLTGTDLRWARLEGARWVDGRICGPGSFGECK